MSWRRLDVHYHGDRDALVLDAVRPLLAHLRGDVPAAYFLRHWRLGPHVRLLFRAEPAVFAARVRPVVDEVVGGFLAARPSTARLDERVLRPAHERLAAAEQEPGPLWPWRPDNSVHETEPDPPPAELASPEAAELLADFHVATNDLAFAMTAGGREGGGRLGPCFDLMVATAHAFSGGGLRQGFVSFRSHADVFLSGTGVPDRVRADWDRRAAAAAAPLRERVAAVVAAVDGRGPALPFVGEWLAAATPVAGRAGRLAAAGRLLRPGDPPPATPDPATGAFHRALLRSGRFWTEIRHAVWFQRYRFLLNCLYLLLTRLGVEPAHRFLLCHLAAGAAEEVLGVTALEIAADGPP